ncbi:hypothetical protein EYF80_064094 [Liparis tanakae]|uniref:Uncharacterized protein n=1 Tax=Liparis tanakae TaxID=230148 RepID=A0A4Z2EAN0_9TELE|nr:hypothetical protein EYF80_064094 [Liparis tanakae]
MASLHSAGEKSLIVMATAKL